MKYRRILLVGLFLALMGGCKGSTSPTTAPTTTTTTAPPQPTEARVTVILGDADITVWSTSPPQARMQFPITIAESAGVRVSVNFVRVELRWTGRSDHRSEMGAGKIVDQYGTNSVAGKGILIMIPGPVFITPLQANLTGMRITVGMRDAFGNDKTWVGASGSMSIRQYNALARSVQ